MHLKLLRICLLIVALAGLAEDARAQSISTGHNYAGFDVGVTGSTLLGGQNFLWRLDQPDVPLLLTYLPFAKLGSGLGLLGGLKVGVAASDNVDIETKLRYQANHVSRQENFAGLILYTPNPSEQTTGLSSYSLTQSSVDLMLMAHYRLLDNFYAAAGADYQTFLRNTLTLHQEIINDHLPHYFYTTGNNSFRTALDRPAAEQSGYFTQVRGSIQLGAGSVFRAGSNSNALVDVELLLSIPFTQWMSSLGRGHLDSMARTYLQPAITYPKLWYASLSIGLRLPFQKLPAREIEGTSADLRDDPVSTKPTLAVTAEQVNDSTGGAVLSGRVTNATNGKPIDAVMTTVNLATNEIVSTTHTDADGNYRVPVTGPGKYSVTAEANGYLFGTADFEVDAQGRILSHHANISLGEATSGRTRLLVFFDFGSAALQPSSTPELLRAVRLMKARTDMRVEIAGYSDSKGPREVNMDLSLKRANAVRDYLVQNGVPKDRVKSKGYGPDSPISTNETDEGRAENRRVEFVVMKN